MSDIFEGFDLPYSTVSITTITEDRSSVQMQWHVTPEFVTELRLMFGEPHAEVMIDGEHLAAAYAAGAPGATAYLPERDCD